TSRRSLPATGISRSPSATKPSTPRKPSRPTWPSSPDGEPSAPEKNTEYPPTPNGKNSSDTSSYEKLPQAPADGLLELPAFTNTVAYAAACTGPTPPNAHASPKSATTSSRASPKLNKKA